MAKRSSLWLIMAVSVVAISLVASGCAKKQMVREELVGKPEMGAKKEEARPMAPQALEKPKEEASTPAAMTPSVKLKEETMPKEGENPFDLAESRIQFAFDDYNLSRKAEERLNKIADWLGKNPGIKIQIQGFTCDIGTDEYNLALGEERALSAEKYLERLGVDSNRLSRISYGRERPRVPNTDEENRTLNRRDEFVMLR